MRKTSVVLFVLLLPILASAFSLDVQIEPADKTIRMNETAEFTLRLSHDQNRDVRVDMYSLDILWDLRTTDSLIIPRGEGLVTTLRVRPLRERDPGFYGIPVTFSAREYNTRVEKTVLVGLRPAIDREQLYTPSIRTSAIIPTQVDPREQLTILVDVENLNRRNISDMTAHVRSNSFSQDYRVSINPLETEQFMFDVSLDPRTRPQDDVLYVTFVTVHDNRTLRFDAKPVEFSIMLYGDIEENVEQTRGFLKLRQESHLTNTGNGPKSITYRIESNMFTALFTSTDPKVSLEDGFYSWQVTLEPGESRTIVMQRNYWPLFVFLLAIAVLLVAYFLFRAPMVVRKEVRKVHPHELRVSVFVRNRSAKALQNVSLVERVPKIFTVSDKFGPGKVKPEHIAKLVNKRTNDYNGTRLRWDIGRLERGDEFVVQYSVATKLALVGTVTLEPIVAHYQAGDRQAEVKSKPASAKVGNL